MTFNWDAFFFAWGILGALLAIIIGCGIFIYGVWCCGGGNKPLRGGTIVLFTIFGATVFIGFVK